MPDQKPTFAYDNPLSAAVSERDKGVLDMVRSALRDRRVTLAYQPIVQCRDLRQVGYYEGLLRILDSTGRAIPAKDFIDTIETREEGRLMDCLSIDLGLQALFQNPNLRLAINMSARSILYDHWEIALERGLRRDPSVAERLILEITESSAMEMPDVVVNFMTRLHRRGITFALDDFGAGYTAFRYLKEFYFDIVKIDADFITNIDTDSDNQVLTNALVSIAQQFDMFTVAEGVERPDEAKFLVDAGIDCLQGYLFGAPSLKPAWQTRVASQATG